MQHKIVTFMDLEAWKKSHALVVEIYKLTKRFPRDEMFGIVNQMRRSAVSITSNIAEGFSRQSSRERLQFNTIARGSLTELQNQLIISRDVGYISAQEFDHVTAMSRDAHKLITGLVRHDRSRHA
jgi:four helix bundle protein